MKQQVVVFANREVLRNGDNNGNIFVNHEIFIFSFNDE
ncbi:hypothetical protein NC99_18130 [Sunxiuqinia dokdonensis]|uniref:Uncharacterized protein n=1 Tax=Sunxiuqinia dokdonensis TaxID=1409788 RepID=A0A0L8VAI4_9BACT|nr:hypothetical protein NC99_18130 [Sunxiuqinia dokdonensis]